MIENEDNTNIVKSNDDNKAISTIRIILNMSETSGLFDGRSLVALANTCRDLGSVKLYGKSLIDSYSRTSFISYSNRYGKCKGQAFKNEKWSVLWYAMCEMIE